MIHDKTGVDNYTLYLPLTIDVITKFFVITSKKESHHQDMRIHFIAIGGSVMHNLAIELKALGYEVTGSDDEIYEPSKGRLQAAGLLPEYVGWYPDKITEDIDAIILGMHARKDNMELRAAQKLGLKIYSYPKFIFEQSKNKKRVVIGGSHGKTTTTSMIMHALRKNGVDYDYLVGAQLDGFERMVRLSDAPVIVLEGDEYLSSPLDRRPKFLHYQPDIAIVTGIAWDHINVFPTFEGYVDQFRLFIQSLESDGKLFYYGWDEELRKLILEDEHYCDTKMYYAASHFRESGKTWIRHEGKVYPMSVFGKHNMENLQAAWYVCKELGVTDEQFLGAMEDFKGAARRLQLLGRNASTQVYWDFAHAPSKVKATVDAVKSSAKEKRLVACLELHTFSSLNKRFHKHYAGTLDKADKAIVFFSEHTLEMKKLPHFSTEQLAFAFKHHNIIVTTDPETVRRSLEQEDYTNADLLLMSSGNFGGIDVQGLAEKITG